MAIEGFVVLGLVLLLVIVALVGLACYFWRTIRHLLERLDGLEADIENLKAHRQSTSESGRDFIKDNVSYKDACFSENESASSRPSSDQSGITRKYTLVAKEKIKTVFTVGAKHMGQLVSTAQLAYTGEVPTRDVNVDDLDVKAASEKDAPVSRSSQRQTIYEGRPTSALLNLAGVPFNLQNNKGVFTHKTVTPAGDTLTVSGVELKIPQGALDHNQQITLGLMWEEAFRPNLTTRQALLGPLVLCQPSVKFKKPVTLVFPHCAHNVQTEWKCTIFKREGNESEASNWAPLTMADHQSMEIGKSHVSINLHHFTGYTLIGESADGKVAAKAVDMVAYANPFQIGAMYKTTIYCISHYDFKEKIKDVDSHQTRLGRKQSDSFVPLLVYLNGENVIVRLSKYSRDEWTLEGGETGTEQELDYQAILHDLTPNCSYILSPKNNPRKIYCEYTFGQNKSERKTNLKVADESPRVAPLPIVSTGDNPESELQRQLVLLLDPEVETLSEQGDWRSLAGKVGLDNDAIRWLDSRRESPTEAVLRKLPELGKTYQDLLDILKSISRPDAAQLVQDFLDCHHGSAGNVSMRKKETSYLTQNGSTAIGNDKTIAKTPYTSI